MIKLSFIKNPDRKFCSKVWVYFRRILNIPQEQFYVLIIFPAAFFILFS